MLGRRTATDAGSPTPGRRALHGVSFAAVAVVAASLLAGLPFVTVGAAAADAGASAPAPLSTDAPPTAPPPTPAPATVTPAPADAAPLGYPALAGSRPDTWAREPHVIVPAPATAGRDIPPGGCVITGTAPVAKVCWQGDAASSTVVALVGDSHAFQWLGAMNRLAEEHHWRLLSIIHNSCPFNTTKRAVELSGYSHCQPAIASAMRLIAASHVRVLLTSAYRTAYLDREPAGVAGYVSTWARLKKMGVAVIALGDTPQPASAPITAQCAAGPHPERCGVTRAVAEKLTDTLAVAAKRARVPYVNTVTAFCRATWCPGVVGNVLVYRDLNHVSNTYLVSALPWLERHVAPEIRSLLHAHREHAPHSA